MKIRKETYDLLDKYRGHSGPNASFDSVIEYLVLKNDPLLPQAPEGYGIDIRKDPVIAGPETEFEESKEEDFKSRPENVARQIIVFLARRSLKARLLNDGTSHQQWMTEWNIARKAGTQKSRNLQRETVKEVIGD